MFNVEFHPKALKEVQKLLRKHKKLTNQFREFYQLLETEPYKFPKKRGKLRACRAISFNIDAEVLKTDIKLYISRNKGLWEESIAQMTKGTTLTQLQLQISEFV